MTTPAPQPPVPTDADAASRHEVTMLLHRLGEEDGAPVNRLFELVYRELRALAQSHLSRERPDHTLQATALVHEAYLRLVDQHRASYQGRAQFFALAATMMRRILVNHARDRGRQKRGGGAARVALSDDAGVALPRDLDLEALDEALERLAALDERKARIVEMRYFAGMSVEETAEVLGVSPATVKREWTLARGWLHREIAAGDPTGSGAPGHDP